MIHVNPMLYVGGYRIYDVTFEPSIVRTVITHGELRRGDVVHLAPLSGDLQIGRVGK
jgi:hypothetical protein